MKTIYIFLSIIYISAELFSQDTFSIVAVDTVTGEVGGAGASCLDNSDISGGVLIINELHPGKGAIHTQAYWRYGNQRLAGNQMDLGMSPEEIVVWLQENDVDGNPSIRQYGIVDFDPSGNPRAAAFTGENCDDYKSHIVGPNYSIQGNILLGQQILDSMEARFLITEGTLADKLMSALQGAKVAGADTRCMDEGVSSQSAFLRIAKQDDSGPPYFIDLVVAETPYGAEPIDSLQIIYDAWKSVNSIDGRESKYVNSFQILHSIQSNSIEIRFYNKSPGKVTLRIYDSMGNEVVSRSFNNKDAGEQSLIIGTELLVQGLYFVCMRSNVGFMTEKFVNIR